MTSRYIAMRSVHSVALLIGVSVVVFLLLHIVPGDPATVLLGEQSTPERLAEVRRALGLDQPLLHQYWRFVSHAVRGDFGDSIRAMRPVLPYVLAHLPATLELSAGALLLSLLVGLPLGMLSAIRRGSLWDSLSVTLALFAQSAPNFWIGVMLIYTFSVQWHLLPVSGRGTVAHVLLPSITLAIAFLGLIMRLTRSSMLEVLGQDYIRTAWAKGLSGRRVVTRHALKNAHHSDRDARGPPDRHIARRRRGYRDGLRVARYGLARGAGCLPAGLPCRPNDRALPRRSIRIYQLGRRRHLQPLGPAHPLPVTERRHSRHLVTWHRARRHRTAVAGAAVFTLILILAIGASGVAPANPLRQNIEARLQRPGWVDPTGHRAWLGTDALGRDVLSRLIYGSRISLIISLVSVACAGFLGFGAGLASGYYGGFVDAILMRVADLQLAFPFILLALAIIALLGPTLVNIMIVFAVTSWPVYARIVRGSVLTLRSQEFVLAARSVGRGHLGILLRHITPNALAPLIVIASFEVARMIIAESALGFLGLGVQPPTPTWGNMVADGRLYIRDAWWLAAFPGLAIMLIATSINLIGDGLRDLLDPRLRSE